MINHFSHFITYSNILPLTTIEWLKSTFKQRTGVEYESETTKQVEQCLSH